MAAPNRLILRVAVPFLGLLGGCGGMETNMRDGAEIDADLVGAEAVVDEYKAIPEFLRSGPAFDAVSKVRGKTVFEIPITSEVPFITAVEEGMRQAAEVV